VVKLKYSGMKSCSELFVETYQLYGAEPFLRSQKALSYSNSQHFIEHKGSLLHSQSPVLSWARTIQTMTPHPTAWRSFLILSTHLCLCLPSGLLHLGLPTKTLHAHFSCFPYVPQAPYISFVWFQWGIQIIMLVILYSPVTLSLLGPNILLSKMLRKQWQRIKTLTLPRDVMFHTLLLFDSWF